jgi:hypothetical protein
VTTGRRAQLGRADTGRRVRTGTTETGMWAQTFLAAMDMWAQTHMGRSRHVGADATTGTDLVGTDVFPEITMSQKLVFGCMVRFVSGVQKILVLLS